MSAQALTGGSSQAGFMIGRPRPMTVDRAMGLLEAQQYQLLAAHDDCCSLRDRVVRLETAAEREKKRKYENNQAAQAFLDAEAKMNKIGVFDLGDYTIPSLPKSLLAWVENSDRSYNHGCWRFSMGVFALCDGNVEALVKSKVMSQFNFAQFSGFSGLQFIYLLNRLLRHHVSVHASVNQSIIAAACTRCKDEIIPKLKAYQHDLELQIEQCSSRFDDQVEEITRLKTRLEELGFPITQKDLQFELRTSKPVFEAMSPSTCEQQVMNSRVSEPLAGYVKTAQLCSLRIQRLRERSNHYAKHINTQAEDIRLLKQFLLCAELGVCVPNQQISN